MYKMCPETKVRRDLVEHRKDKQLPDEVALGTKWPSGL